jgi:hypothetical protein
MTIGDAGGERDQAWRGLLDDCRPPHRNGDSFTPAMWQLLQVAVDEPGLRSMYPWTSMNILHVSVTGDFRDYAGEPFPAIAAWSGGFTVMTHPWGEDNIVLETLAPAEAVACMIRLMEAREVFPEAE